MVTFLDPDLIPTSSPLAKLGQQDSTPPPSNGAEMWEIVLVAACPIIFIVFLCVCVVYLVIRSYERRAPLAQRVQSSTPIASILRQLPPPPKYDIAVTSVDAPPPTYADVFKDPLAARLRTTPSSANPVTSGQFASGNHLSAPTVEPLNIQYLYPPKYEAKVKAKPASSSTSSSNSSSSSSSSSASATTTSRQLNRGLPIVTIHPRRTRSVLVEITR